MWGPGCAAWRPVPPPPWSLPDPALAPFTGQRQQSVTLRRDGLSLAFLAVLDRQGSTVTLVALNPLGQRLVKVTWDRQGVQVEASPALGAGFDAQQALRDLVFASWPPGALNAALGAGPWHALFHVNGDRDLILDGHPRLQVRGRPSDPGGQRLLHWPEGYSITVRDLAAGDD